VWKVLLLLVQTKGTYQLKNKNTRISSLVGMTILLFLIIDKWKTMSPLFLSILCLCELLTLIGILSYIIEDSIKESEIRIIQAMQDSKKDSNLNNQSKDNNNESQF